MQNLPQELKGIIAEYTGNLKLRHGKWYTQLSENTKNVISNLLAPKFDVIYRVNKGRVLKFKIHIKNTNFYFHYNFVKGTGTITKYPLIW